MDGNRRNAELIRDFLTEQGYAVDTVTDLSRTEEVVDTGTGPGFAIIDIDRFDDSIWDYCRQLHERGVPFMILSGVRAGSLERQSEAQGSRSFVEKPIQKRDLLEIVRTAIGD